MFSLLLSAAVAPLLLTDISVPAGTQLTYKGSVVAAGDVDTNTQKAFDLTLWVLSSGEGGSDVAWLVERGYLAPSRAFGRLAAVEDLRAIRTQRGDYDRKELAQLMLRLPVTEAAVADYQAMGEGRPAFAFCVGRHHAEVVALRVGEPFGTLILALAVTVIEAGLIISLMLGGDPNPGLMRDSVHAAVMLVLHGLAGACIVVASWRHRNAEFRVDGANSFLAVLIPMATLFAYGISGLVTGAVFTEKIFGWHGMGEWVIQGIATQDTNIIAAVTVFTGAAVLLAGLLSDVIYAALDPRVRVA